MNGRRALVALVVILSGCGCSGQAVTIETDGLSVTDPWIRTPPPFANTAALYTIIENGSPNDDSLIAIESPSCRQFELHRTTTESGIASMAEVRGLEIAAGGSLVLEPGGLHGMCLGLADSLRDGDQVDVELTFTGAGLVQLRVPVERR
jgi:copper(I)-binding protein